MQVFLPYPSFEQSTACLDPLRLGNQIYREALTLVRGGWPHHPVSKMWTNHKHALAKYCLTGLEELDRRGRHYPHWQSYFAEVMVNNPDTGLPKCVGNDVFHASHRSNLLRKDPVWYSKFGWTETPDLPYVWIF